MNKEDINSILLANLYLLSCNSTNPLCRKKELARKYLTHKIAKALKGRQNKKTTLRLFGFIPVSLSFLN